MQGQWHDVTSILLERLTMSFPLFSLMFLAFFVRFSFGCFFRFLNVYPKFGIDVSKFYIGDGRVAYWLGRRPSVSKVRCSNLGHAWFEG